MYSRKFLILLVTSAINTSQPFKISAYWTACMCCAIKQFENSVQHLNCIPWINFEGYLGFVGWLTSWPPNGGYKCKKLIHWVHVTLSPPTKQLSTFGLPTQQLSTFGLKGAKFWLDMTIRDHLKWFEAIFDLASFLVFFWFRPTFWLMWARIGPDMMNADHLKAC